MSNCLRSGELDPGHAEKTTHTIDAPMVNHIGPRGQLHGRALLSRKSARHDPNDITATNVETGQGLVKISQLGIHLLGRRLQR